MKKGFLLLSLLFFFFVGTTENRACSPTQISFMELLTYYNPNDYIIVEGYYREPAERNLYSSKFVVEKSSDTSIKVGQEYLVYEYGPFGSMCEMYEMGANVSKEFTGKENTRFLILYKGMSVDGKLVTPIFWSEGVKAADNKIVTQEYDFTTRMFTPYECTASLDEIWRQIRTNKKLELEWKAGKPYKRR